MIKVMVVDDHTIAREGFEAMIESTGGFEVVAAFADGESAAREIGGVRPDVVVLDIRLPGMDGFATLEAMRKVFPEVKVLLFAGMPLKGELERAKEMRAQGYLPKNVDTGKLLSALREAAAGGAFQEEELVEAPKMLTARELECLKYLALGKTREEVRIIMGISFETVRSFVRSIQSKLDSPNTAGAVSRAYELGILRP